MRPLLRHQENLSNEFVDEGLFRRFLLVGLVLPVQVATLVVSKQAGRPLRLTNSPGDAVGGAFRRPKIE